MADSQDPRITRLLDLLAEPGTTEEQVALIESKLEALRKEQGQRPMQA